MTSDAQLVRRLYENFNARDAEAVLAMLTDDVMWANGMDGGYHHGRDAVREYWARQWAMIDPHVTPETISEAEDGSTAVDVHQVVHDLGGKLLLDEKVQHVFRVEDGRVARFDIRSASQLSSVVHGT